MTFFDHALFVVLAFLFPLRAAAFTMRRLERAPLVERPRVRLTVYRQAMMLQWTLAAGVVALWLATGRGWHALGVVPAVTPGFLGVGLVFAIVAAVFLIHRRGALQDDQALESVRERMRHVEIMLPHDAREARTFYRLSFTAGVCEELLYRGYLIWYLAHWMGPLPAAGLASLVFGVGHTYQGWRGVLSTGLLGGLLAALYLISGSLLIPIAVHMLLDMHSGHLAYRAYTRQREQMLAEVEPAGEAWQRSQQAPGAVQPASQASADVIVAGLGAMGSAVADHMARRGLRVLGFDRFHPPHDRGSSHGQTRLIREAYFESPLYVPIVRRAYELWEGLERDTERTLITTTGGLMVGPPEGTLVSGAILSAETHGLRYEKLDAAAIRDRFPGFEPDDAMVGVWEPRTGYVFPEAAVEAQLERARRGGARLHFDEPVQTWSGDASGVTVETAAGRYTAAKLVLCAGPWIGGLVSDLALPLTVTRQPLFWFAPRAECRSDPARYPSYIWEHEADRYFYGFPALAGEVKATFHVRGEIISPDDERREAGPAEAEALMRVLERHMPDVPGRFLRGVVCRYTNLPDAHFLLDFHPAWQNVFIASACSGHGFKFAPAVGEIVADLMTSGTARHDLSLFGLSRFTRGG